MQPSHRNLTTKKIYQLKINFSKQYNPPYKEMNPYVLLNQLNKAIKEKYDVQFVYVKYDMTKNKQQKYLSEHFSPHDAFQIDLKANNILNSSFDEKASQFLRNEIFGSIQKLKPPADYNPEDDEQRREKQSKAQQNERLTSLRDKIKGIMGMYNKLEEYKEDPSKIRLIQSFKQQFKKQQFATSEYEVKTKVLMNGPVYEKIMQDSKERGKTMIQIKYNNKSIRLYLLPQKETFDQINHEYRINNWSLNFCYKQSKEEQIFSHYFGTQDLLEKFKGIKNNIRFVSSVSFNENQSRTQSFSITTFLWNQTVMKTVVKLAQIKKVEKAKNGDEHQYYFHLTYPPMYYINQLKVDEAYSQKFMKFSDRVTNFIFLQGNTIKKNYFLKYYLFNNTILKVSLKLDDSLQGGNYYPVSEAYRKLENMCEVFSGTIQYSIKPSFYKKKYNLKFLAEKMDYRKFEKTRMDELSKQSKDKIWMIKYLILSMVRYNYIIPVEQEISPIMKQIQDDKKNQSIDCYLYVLWRTATNMWGYTQKEKFCDYFKREVQQVKKMNVKNIMKRLLEQSESIVYIFRVSLTPSGYLFNPPTPQMKGRLMKEYVDYSQFFLRVSICQESQIQLKNQKYITKMAFRSNMSEIQILGRAYIPLGWSPSQLRSFSLWYFHQIKVQRKYQNSSQPLKVLQRRHILQFLGDFSKIDNPAKKAARIGQSFSSSWTFKSNQILCTEIKDIYSSQGINFTDGIGKISSDLMQTISLRLNIRDLSVIQVRYKGAKGVLVLDPELKKNQIQLRPSMIKYQCQAKRAEQYLDILDWNKYKCGFLNRQIIILLRTLGVENVVFTGLQQEHIDRISKMTFKDCSIFKHMQDDLNTQINNLQPANKTILSLLNAGFELQKQPFFRGVLQTLKKNGYHQLKVKSNIRIQKSARIIGIADQWGILEENQIYCSIYDHFFIDKPIKEVVEGPAVITRNPCLHPADIRVVRCIGTKEIEERFQKIKNTNKFANLWNVVIMPIKGKYPLTSQISGSDLDGDNFFICWDDRLIPKIVHPPVIIDELPKAGKKQEKQSAILSEDQTYEKMLDFFIDYTNYQKLGQIDNSHLVHADQDLINYANNNICLQLATIHGKAVDFPKTGYCPSVNPKLFCSEYPDFMEKQNANSYISESILGKLYRDIKERIKNLLEDKVYTNVNEIDRTLIQGYQYDQTSQQIKRCIQILRQYERQMTNLISILGVDSQYEIYSGNFSMVKNKIKIFGKNRLIASIIGLRQRFFELFFKNLTHEDQLSYKSSHQEEKHLRVPKYFSEKTRREAQMYYLISYIRKFPDIKGESQGFRNLKQKIEKVLEELKISNKEQKYCGFVWFIIPKIIINLKITWRASQNGDKIEEEEYIGQQQAEDDEQYL